MLAFVFHYICDAVVCKRLTYLVVIHRSWLSDFYFQFISHFPPVILLSSICQLGACMHS